MVVIEGAGGRPRGAKGRKPEADSPAETNENGRTIEETKGRREWTR